MYYKDVTKIILKRNSRGLSLNRLECLAIVSFAVCVSMGGCLCVHARVCVILPGTHLCVLRFEWIGSVWLFPAALPHNGLLCLGRVTLHMSWA